jgi:hypothetical protein
MRAELQEAAPDWSRRSSRSGIDGSGGAAPVGLRSCGQRRWRSSRSGGGGGGGGAAAELLPVARPAPNRGNCGCAMEGSERRGREEGDADRRQLEWWRMRRRERFPETAAGEATVRKKQNPMRLPLDVLQCLPLPHFAVE